MGEGRLEDSENYRIVSMPLFFRRILKQMAKHLFQKLNFVKDWETFQWSGQKQILCNPYFSWYLVYFILLYQDIWPNKLGKNLWHMNLDMSRISNTVCYTITMNKPGKHGPSVNGQYWERKTSEQLFSKLNCKSGGRLGASFLGWFLQILP